MEYNDHNVTCTERWASRANWILPDCTVTLEGQKSCSVCLIQLLVAVLLAFHKMQSSCHALSFASQKSDHQIANLPLLSLNDG